MPTAQPCGSSWSCDETPEVTPAGGFPRQPDRLGDRWEDVRVAGRGASEGAEKDLGHLDALSEPAVVTDPEARIRYVNTAAEHLLGVRARVLIGKHMAQAVFGSDDQDPFREAAEQALAGMPWLGELDVV